MKKLFGIVAAAAMVLLACVFTGCAHEYTGNYYNTEFVTGITPTEFENDFEPIEYLEDLYTYKETWKSKPGYEKKENLTSSELYDYIDPMANWKLGTKGVIDYCDKNTHYLGSINCNDGESYNLLYIEIVK